MNDLELPEPLRSAFYTTIWQIVRKIPTGQVASYGQIASMIPVPPAISPEDYKAYRARWAGNAMAACPADVPWQRVINSQGKISARRGADLQRKLLEAEGVVFDAHDRVDFARYGWPGPPAEWLRANGLLDENQQLSLF